MTQPLPVSSTGFQLLQLPSNMIYRLLQGVVLAATFAVSHNIAEAKPVAAGSETTNLLRSELAERDWGVQQASEGAAPNSTATLIQPGSLRRHQRCAPEIPKQHPT